MLLKTVTLTVLCLFDAVLGQYDELTILQEILDRTEEPNLKIESTTTLPNEVKILKPDENVEEGSGIDIETEGRLIIVPSTEAPSTPTPTSTSTSIEPIDTVLTGLSGSTSEPSVVSVTVPTTTSGPIISSTDESDDTLFGFKTPDLATIYRRIFPFNDPRIRPASRPMRP